jgi:hypothetical protein
MFPSTITAKKDIVFVRGINNNPDNISGFYPDGKTGVFGYVVLYAGQSANLIVEDQVDMEGEIMPRAKYALSDTWFYEWDIEQLRQDKAIE